MTRDEQILALQQIARDRDKLDKEWVDIVIAAMELDFPS